MMIRNPWGTAGFNKDWGPQDVRWTSQIAQQVIDRTTYDPRTSTEQKGVMFIPVTYIKECFSDIAIAQIHEGFTDNWYDALDMDDKFHSYYFEVPTKDDDFYITVETYSENIVPLQCTTSDESHEYLPADLTSPQVSIIVYKANETDKQFTKVTAKRYLDMMHIPIKINTLQYQAGDVFAVDVKYQWFGSTGNDYTVKVHSKMDITIRDKLNRVNQLHTDGQSPTEFKTSQYCGMNIDCTPNETFKAKLSDANSETYSGDVWYLKSDIPTTFFSKERDNNPDEVIKGLVESGDLELLDGEEGQADPSSEEQ